MENIHVLPTDKPSNLYLEEGFYKIDNLVFGSGNHHMYITSDEKVKDGDWYLTKHNEVYKSKVIGTDNNGFHFCKKIILTTDTDLIKDGVQGIDDEFLEWFVKNPSCKEVEVLTDAYTMQEIFELNLQNGVFKYKIIIPQEEPKCLYDTPISCENSECRVLNKCNGDRVKPKQETLEEAALRIIPDKSTPGWVDGFSATERIGFVKGANWQAEQMYSEEDMISFVTWLSSLSFDLQHFNEKGLKPFNELFPIWFEKFKNK